MSADTDATRSFSIRETPWWDSTAASVRADYPATIEQAREWAGLTWEPVAEPVYAAIPGFVDGGFGPTPTTTYQPVEGHKRVSRTDNSAITLGIPSDRWEGIDNHAPFELASLLLAEDGTLPEDAVIKAADSLADLGVKIETAGYLRQGDTLWVCGKLDNPVVLPGDFSQTQSYVVVTLNHAGNGALKAVETYIRAVCKNTLQTGDMDAERRGTAFSFRHSASWRDQLDAARSVVRSTRNNLERLSALYSELDFDVDDDLVEDFIVTLVPGAEDPKIAKRSKTNILNDRQTIRTMLHSETTAPVSGKALGLFLAAGEFFDHGRRYRSRDTYITRTLLNQNAGKAIALDIIGDLTDRKLSARELVAAS